MRWPLLIATLIASPLWAADWDVPNRAGAISETLAQAADGDTLRLAPGIYAETLVLSRPVTLDGMGRATIDGQGTGSVITVTGPGVTLRGLTVIGSGSDHDGIDSGIQLTKTARAPVVENNVLIGNLYGVDIHGAKDALVKGNRIEGRQDRRMNARGNGVYVWNAPGAVVEGNDIQYGRDGIFVNSSRRNLFRDNLFRDLRFAVHYMYADNSEVSGNVSIGNDLGYAVMFTSRVKVVDNVSIGDREHGVMLNYANDSVISGNVVKGAKEKCTFLYNANKNEFTNNWFEGCGIGIHFTAGSERNRIVGNAFVGNRTQVKYVSTRWVEWSEDGRGNYWSDFAAYDVNGDGIADAPYRPNDSMDHVLWTQPAAKLLLGSPAVQLLRWSQSAFPALLPGGVIDSNALIKAPEPSALKKVPHDG
ncbi:nitrous oxide maturation protein NosD (plasmid) [Ruegeria pomeroyi DSS-3]|uniref:Nitrous oxide maturation protein NosD n=2 Tax=Ruegeria pomeroyi TaxID=89184 RepID=Q5LLH6_RUEPO|nr:nitrous oxide reductase family maturation protein NosD [Ruegeria pomeroyi]AAV97191.1 nitrous oxide maturation protein NosD [Ruegeria pomeroyi DSS-3]NVK95587.1 nitrous oxide reductase family maturation protein NosD [Ruegeria pomeroyi]NVL00354.1 nitrous oxide reductase family maturation protein NosD [Ruegeria pomeroyi]HCE70402.1 nitrous oxide reductase family maturation protein NosD [Ruegeria sp.]